MADHGQPEGQAFASSGVVRAGQGRLHRLQCRQHDEAEAHRGGRAEILPDGLPSEQPGYLDKYEEHYAAIDYDVPKFDKEYHVRIRIRPSRSWGF